MFKRVLTAFLGTRHEREKKRLQPIVEAIHSHEERLASVSEEELRAQTEKFRGILRERTTGYGLAKGGLQAEARPLVVYASDGSHPTVAGTYVTAAVLLSVTEHVSASDVSWAPSGLAATERATLAAVVDEVAPP